MPLRSGGVNGIDIAESTTGLPAVAPLLAAGGIGSTAAPGASISRQGLASVVDEAIAYWAAAGLDDSELTALGNVEFQIANLDAQGYLGLAGSTLVIIDDDGAGYGWYVGDTANVPSDRMDLLSVVAHELGHVLGHGDHHADSDSDHVMANSLATGTRRLPTAELDEFFSSVADDGPLLPY